MIPKIIFQTSAFKKITSTIHRNFNDYSKFCTGYEYVHFDDNECIEFLKNNFIDTHPFIVDKFKQLDGPHKADLIRYAYLYINGGVYIDIDIALTSDLDEIIKDYEFVSVFTRKKCSKISPMIMNGFIATIPKHQVLLKCIDFICATKLNKFTRNYLLICHNLGLHLEKYVEEKLINNKSIYKKNVKLLEDNHYTMPSYCNIIDITLQKRVMYHKFDLHI